ncbi:hypothetical protein AMECASPLE_003228 [Ameca splendens]|uniref:Uncharacterized protein n=1 Tax=Ameca splendens TaxID=208324 RepID=A0ABV0XYW6_9TELE
MVRVDAEADQLVSGSKCWPSAPAALVTQPAHLHLCTGGIGLINSSLTDSLERRRRVGRWLLQGQRKSHANMLIARQA